MSKDKKRKDDDAAAAAAPAADATAAAPPPAARAELSNMACANELKKPHVELVKRQQWAVAEGLKVCIVFEGRDGAGKGGTIQAITERVSPRVFRVVALPAPTEREKSQMYVQRHLPHFPAAGEVVIFDRSWYNRTGVERVMGLCTERQTEEFLRAVPLVERAMVDSGIILLKHGLELSPDEPTRRLRARFRDGRKTSKLSPMDLKSYSRWYDYSRARRDVRRERHRARAVVRRPLRLQAQPAAEPHQPPAERPQGRAAPSPPPVGVKHGGKATFA